MPAWGCRARTEVAASSIAATLRSASARLRCGSDWAAVLAMLACLRRLWTLDGQPRQAAIDALGEPPAGLAEQIHQRGHQHQPNDEGIEEHCAREPEAE